MEKLVKVFKALSDETRLNILLLVSKRSVCQKGISKYLGISDSAVSQHIKVLKEANIIIAYKQGYYVMYELNEKVLEEAIGFINLLIHKNTDLISNEYNFNIEEVNTARCKRGCKSMKGCCKNKIESVKLI